MNRAACITLLVLLGLGLGRLTAEDRPRPPAIPSPEQLREYLASDEPADVAWGAYLAGALQEPVLAEDLQQALRRWPAERTGPSPLRWIADAFVRLELPCDEAGLDALAQGGLLVEALVLATGEPERHEDWFLQRLRADRGLDTEAWHVCVAALVQHRSAEVASLLLADLQLHVDIHVQDPPPPGGIGNNKGGGQRSTLNKISDGLLQSPAGFPPPTWHTLSLNATRGGRVLWANRPWDEPGLPIIYHRRAEGDGEAMGVGKVEKGREQRQRWILPYLSRLAELPSTEELPRRRHSWKPHWQSGERLRQDVQDRAAALAEEFRALTGKLLERGLLPDDPVQLTLVMAVHDRREQAEEPLPDLPERMQVQLRLHDDSDDR